MHIDVLPAYEERNYVPDIELVVEEAVVNAIVAGEDTPSFKPKGQTIPGIDTARLKALF